MSGPVRNLGVEFRIRNERMKQDAQEIAQVFQNITNNVKNTTQNITVNIKQQAEEQKRTQKSAMDLWAQMQKEQDRATLSSLELRKKAAVDEAAQMRQQIRTIAKDRQEYESLMLKNSEVLNAKLMALHKEEQAAQTANASGIKAWAGEFVGAMVGPLAALTAATAAFSALKNAIHTGFEGNIQGENLSIGLGATISGTSSFMRGNQSLEGAEKFAAAEDKAREALQRFNIEATKTQFTGSQLAETAMTLSSVYMGLGRNTDQLVEFTTKLATAASATAMPIQQVARETDEILQGRITVTNTFYQRFKGFLNTKELIELKQGGVEAAEVLEKALDRLQAAAEAHRTSWEGVTSTLNSVWGQFTKMATEPAFKEIERGLNEIADAMFTGEGNAKKLNPELKEMAQWLGKIAETLTKIPIGVLRSINTVSAHESGQLTPSERKQVSEYRMDLDPWRRARIAFGFESPIIEPAKPWLPTPNGQPIPATEVAKAGQMTAHQIQDKIKEMKSKVKDALNKHALKAAEEAISEMEQFGLEHGDALSPLQGQVLQTTIDGFRSQVGRMQTSDASHAKATQRAAENAVKAAQNRAAKAFQHFYQGLNIAGQILTPDYQFDSESNSRIELPNPSGFAAPNLSPYELYRAGMHDPGFDAWKKKRDDEYTFNQSRVGTELDPMVKNYRDWKKREADKWNSMLSGFASAGGDLANQAINEGGIKASSLLRTLGNLGSLLGPQGAVLGAGLNIVGGYLDQRDKALDVYTRQANGEQVSRKDYLEASKAKHSDAFIRFYNSDFYDHDAVSNDLKSFDTKNFNRLMLGTLKGPMADRDRAQQDLDDQVAKMSDKDSGYTPEQVAAYKSAREAEIKAMYNAAKAAEEFGRKASNFQTTMGLAGMKESLGLGAVTADDIKRGLYGAGLDKDKVFSRLSDKDVRQSLLSELEYLKKDADAGGKGFQSSYGYWAAKGALGSAGVDISGMDEAAVITMLKDVLLPAAQQITQMTASQSIGSVNAGDNSLTFDAPQTRNLTVNQTIAVNTYAVTGDKASFRALVKDIMAEANTVLGQAF